MIALTTYLPYIVILLVAYFAGSKQSVAPTTSAIDKLLDKVNIIEPMKKPDESNPLYAFSSLMVVRDQLRKSGVDDQIINGLLEPIAPLLLTGGPNKSIMPQIGG